MSRDADSSLLFELWRCGGQALIPEGASRQVGPGTCAQVLTYWAAHASPERPEAWPALRTAEAHLGINRRSIENALSVLVGEGLLTRTEASRNRARVYVCNVAEWQRRAALNGNSAPVDNLPNVGGSPDIQVTPNVGGSPDIHKPAESPNVGANVGGNVGGTVGGSPDRREEKRTTPPTPQPEYRQSPLVAAVPDAGGGRKQHSNPAAARLAASAMLAALGLPAEDPSSPLWKTTHARLRDGWQQADLVTVARQLRQQAYSPGVGLLVTHLADLGDPAAWRARQVATALDHNGKPCPTCAGAIWLEDADGNMTGEKCPTCVPVARRAAFALVGAQ